MTPSTRRSSRLLRNTLCLVASALWACSDAQEADRVELRVVADAVELVPVTTDLGYAVDLSAASIAIDNLKFTVAGETHASLGRWLSELLLPPAHAHPGHFQGGEVTGELRGHFVLRFAPGEVQTLGTATLLVGTYKSVNLTLSRADAESVEEGDPVAGHTAVLSGTAAREDANIAFDVVMDSPEGRELVGIPFEEEVTADTRNALALRFGPLDRLEMDTLFDGIDFALLDADGDGYVSIDPAATDEAIVDAYNTIRRAFQSHDHFVVRSGD